MCEHCETQVCPCVGATCPDKSPLTLSCLTAHTVFAQWINHTHTHTCIKLQWPPQHLQYNPPPKFNKGYECTHVFMCVCISTHVQWPAEGVLLHTAPLCFLTLQRQVLLQETIELLQSWQPPHQRHTDTEEGFVIVCAREAKRSLSRCIVSPQFCLNSEVRIRAFFFCFVFS